MSLADVSLSTPDAATHRHPSRAAALGSRWLGVGLAAGISVVTLMLAFAGQLTLYISPESVWFACAAAVVTIAGAIWSCTLPLGAESDHDHDHDHGEASGGRRAVAVGATAVGGVIASAVVAGAVLLPPASLSVSLALSRDTGGAGLFAGADVATLGAASDTSSFGVGEWSTVFATATRPELYDGAAVTLTGFLTPGADDNAQLTRLVITHCVIDAQPASVPVDIADWQSDYAVGDWVEIAGTVRVASDGSLSIEPADVAQIEEPGDPYEH